MRRIDLTESFRTYREAARLLWNVFLRNNPDRELDFLDVDSPLFHAILQAKLDIDLKPTEDKWSYFSDLRVVSADRNALVLQETGGLNIWSDRSLPKGISLRYSGLFDFDSDSATYRDFEYIACVATRVDSGRLVSDGVWLISASTARVYFAAKSGAKTF